MFIPHNYLKLLSLVFDYSGVTKEAARNDKLGFKEHSSLERHQEAYRHTLNLFVENLAQNHPKLLLEYASNFQRFINELQSLPFETSVNQSKGDDIFWRYLYAPMIAALLHKYLDCEYEGNAIHFLGKFLISMNEAPNYWSSEPTEKNRWAKNIIKSQIEFLTPNFTARINDIRGTSIRSITTIKNDILILEEDLKKLDDKNIDIQMNLQKVKSSYIAAMVIRRLEGDGLLSHLKLITEYLVNFDNLEYTDSRLLILHKRICTKLLRGDIYNEWQTKEGAELISHLEQHLVKHISPTFPAIQYNLLNSGSDDLWPDPYLLYKELVNYYGFRLYYEYEDSLLTKTLLDYYKMFHCTEKSEFQKALSFYEKVESAIYKVHLGKFLAAALVHKIVLHWLISSTMKHNQFDSEITTIALNIQDENEFCINEFFIEYLENLTDGEMMMFKVFKLFNRAHPKIAANPLQTIEDAMSLAIILCENNNSLVEDLLPVFQKQFNTKYKRTLSVVPFCRLTLSQSVDMLPELFVFVGLSINHKSLHNFNSNTKCRQLIEAYDSKLMQRLKLVNQDN
ncbi:hypothetical protein [Pseudoalteromonas sp. SWXJZ10B]|uniref:hypothetical protein n=1 Tax=Pseudoalteromonas sp. SWXJZ10B TaxID=2792063 RepID=UPI0018CF577B|nr:hypothetical protein [Pseudoalteromonas sp. SWXJZ10B]MBH0041437.1 hypothetical protein [Pseudoalteromonas sp. SWXJZ10B]